MRNLLLNPVAAFIICFIMPAVDAGAAEQVPDFNYPQTVIKNADKLLEKSLADGNHHDVVKYLIQSTIAEAQISSDNIPGILNKIDRVAASETDSAAVAVMHYLKAVVYTAYFSNDSYTIIQRNQVDEPSDDISEWAAADFIEAVSGCLSRALEASDALWNTPVKLYTSTDDLSATIYPTMLDMVVYRGVDLVKQISDFSGYGVSAGGEAVERADSICRDAMMMLVARHKGDAAPYIMARLETADMGYDDDIAVVAKSLYDEFYDNEYCYLALERHLMSVNDSKERYKLMGDYLSRFPSSTFAPKARNYMAAMAAPSVNLEYDKVFSTVDSIVVKVKAENVHACRLLVYRVPDGMAVGSQIVEQRSQLPLVAETEAHMTGTVPFSDTVEVKMKPLPYGRYIVLPDYNDMLDECSIYPQEFCVTDISLFTTNSAGGIKVFAVDAITGKPVKGVYINLAGRNNMPPTGRISAYRTNADGYNLIKADDKRMNERVVAVNGDDCYGMSIYASEFYLSEAEPEYIEVNTDLAVYRPGDTMRYVAVCYHIDRNNRRVVDNLPVVATLYDSNYREIATDTLVTDELGRVEGAFDIPRDRMNGLFRIEVESDVAGGTKVFNVSEYKTPTFFVEFDGEQQSFARDTDVTLTGRAEYFTGLPVADAQVTLTLNYQLWSWWYRVSGDGTFLHVFDAVTDAAGRFTITIPSEMLNASDMPWRSQFNLEATVTDAVGESQSGAKLFWLGDARSIETTGEDFVFEVSRGGEVELPIEVRSSSPADTSLVCHYALCGAKNIEGTFAAGKPVVDLSSLPSGEYQMKITIEGDTTVDFGTTIVVFRATDKLPPVKSPLWIPNNQLAVSEDNEASLLIGNSNEPAYIYCIAASKKGVVKETWLRYDKGLHRLTIDIPKQEDEYIDLTLITHCDRDTRTWSHRFESRMNVDTLRIVPVSFRDNLIPGMPETWSFKLVNQDGEARRGALICDMYDKALDMVATHSWSFVPQMSNSRLFNFSISRLHGVNVYTSQGADTEMTVNYDLPDLNYYGRNYSGRFFSRNMVMRSMASAKMYDAVGSFEADDMAAESLEEVAVTEGASQMLDNVSMRTADIQNALWQPILTTDAEGNVAVTFNSPQFNTTWLFKVIAYTHDLHTASMVREVVTRKPVMVKASLPRFVRNGDNAMLSAMLLNATDSVQHCSAVVELFDVSTGSVLMSRQFTVSLEANASEALDIEWSVPAEMSVVGYRVKAATAEFGDGEQHLLPVLPSVSPVIETSPFYLTDNMTWNMSVNGDDALDGRFTLEFCNNPVWYCVMALPSIRQDDYITANGLAHSLYAIALAQGIAGSNPDIKQAVDAWLENESDSTLVSNLAKNEDLKIGSLLASPWINEADRQTLRMQSIGELFDSLAIAGETAKVIGKMRDLQMPDGGWTWLRYNGCTSSQYVTMQVLQLIGELQHIGYLTDNVDVNAMVTKAVAYLDRCAVDNYNKLADKNRLSSFYEYAYIRSLFPGEKFDDEAKAVFKSTLKYMKSHWGDDALGLGDKAWCAMALYRNGEKRTAVKIMQSVREYGISGKNGLYWDNFLNGNDRGSGRVAVTSVLLQAFGEVCASDVETIDAIRQWMLLQKQSTDWGNSSLAADAVYSILSTGSKWLDEETQPVIMFNGQPLEYAPGDAYLGYFRKQLQVDGDFNLSIDRRGATVPAWGAVYRQYSAKMDAIVAAKTDDISVEKQVCKLDGAVLGVGDSLAMGDKVMVRLVIKNTRDLQFVMLNDERAACCEPVDQLSGYRYEGVGYYLEIKDSETHMFFNYLPKGTHVVTYEVSITSPGTYSVGIATVQSQYAPQITAHSSGTIINIGR